MQLASTYFNNKGFAPHEFQKQTWEQMHLGNSGLLNAPTGFGKTFAVWFGVLHNYYCQPKALQQGLHCLYITPLRALAKEIENATQEVSKTLELNYSIELRTGDSSSAIKAKQKKKPPQAFITTPESIHILFSSSGYSELLSNVNVIIVDEWHELIGSKRGVMVELLISKIKSLNPKLIVWGISATIGNLLQAKEILLFAQDNTTLVKANIEKKINITTVYPPEIEHFSWGGHMGLKLLPQLIDVINKSKSCLVFTNTRGQSEAWYQHVLLAAPELAGQLAVHHGSLSSEVRKWVEDGLHNGTLKVVIATSSLDLGVDFSPVDTVVQIGSPKGVARIMQRAGRSGHKPFEVSELYFLPTHTLEILEGAAIKYGYQKQTIEQRTPYVQSFDVLLQYMVTLAISEGFQVEQLYNEVIKTHCFAALTIEEFNWCINFLTNGGNSLNGYADFNKIVNYNGTYYVANKKIAHMHRLSIGVIVSDSMLTIKMLGGKRLGMVEEYFVAKLTIGDAFWFNGQNLVLHKIKDMEVLVRKGNGKKGITPSWMGGTMPLSNCLSAGIKEQLHCYAINTIEQEELHVLSPVLDTQQHRSHVPKLDEFLIEYLETEEGHHYFFYPIEGRFVHEGMAAIISYRIGRTVQVSFSISINNYGFELLSNIYLDIKTLIANGLMDAQTVYDDALKCLNSNQMAARRFRDIASIAGLVFTGYPGKEKKTRHLQASSQLFFQVFQEVEPNNLLLQQAYQEILDFQLEYTRMYNAFVQINKQKIIIKHIKKPTPFCFPIFVDRFREKYTSATLQTRIDEILSDNFM